MTTSLTTEMQDNGNILLTTPEGGAVGRIDYHVKTRRFEPVMFGTGCADNTSFRSLEAAEYVALAHHLEIRSHTGLSAGLAYQADRKAEQLRQNNIMVEKLLSERAER